MIALRTGAATDVGRVRTNNEDQMLVTDALFAVADGMGAGFGSEPTADGLVDATKRANRVIAERAEADTALRGMGTTLCAAALVANQAGDGDALVVVNVGDSRAYLLRDGELSRVTDDHSVTEELMRAGQMSEEQAATDNRRHVLTRVLGMDTDVDVDRFELDPFRGDRLLLATDGLCNEVPDAEIASILRRLEDPGEAARELVRCAKTNGGSDNVTVVIVDVIDDDGRVTGATAALAADPPRPRHLPTAADLDGEVRVAPTVGRPEQFVEPRSRGRRLRIGAFGLAVLLLIALAGGAFVAFGRPWYVSADAGRVALFRGHGHGLFGEQLVTRTATPIDTLDGVARDRVANGVRFSSRHDAEAYIARLTTSTTTTSSTSSTTSVTVTSTSALRPTTTIRR